MSLLNGKNTCHKLSSYLVFELTILGSNSAMPSFGRHQTAQILNIHDKFYLIDCGEGTQMRLSYYKKRYSRISHIFISHLHGDHYLGLVGLLSTMNAQGRTEPIHLFAPPNLRDIILLMFKHSETILRYKLHFYAINPDKAERIMDEPLFTVDTIPLAHSVPCTGFLFREKPKNRKIIKQKLTPSFTLANIIDLKHGKDTQVEGVWIKNEEMTIEKRTRSYAFCSDTTYQESVIEQVKEVNLLYHEATFMKGFAEKAAHTQHSTTQQAAMVAQRAQVEKLIIGHYSSRYRELTPLLLEARETFVNTELALEGRVFSVHE